MLTNMLALDDKDVESGIDGFIDFVAMIFNSLVAFFDMLPPVITGGIFCFIGFVALYHWAKSR